MPIFKAGIRQLKSNLSEYMRRVKNGGTILVTKRGKPIGQIVPVKPTIEEKLQSVVDAGLAEWNGRKFAPRKPVAVNACQKQVADLVAENRNVDDHA